MAAGESTQPRIVVTVQAPSLADDPDLVLRKIELYVGSVTRHGAEALVLDETSSGADRSAAFETADGLLLTGGGDLEPSRYGRPNHGSTGVQQGRDELEAAAWAASQAKGLPVLGICRGFQAINVFSGGTLVQHVDGHRGPNWGAGPALTHPIRVAAGSRLARILFPTNARGGVVTVNSYHHQGVRRENLAPGLVASGLTSSSSGELIEALEAADGRFVFGLQSHPERTESTPPAFERLFAVFVDAARGPVRR